MNLENQSEAEEQPAGECEPAAYLPLGPAGPRCGHQSPPGTRHLADVLLSLPGENEGWRRVSLLLQY